MSDARSNPLAAIFHETTGGNVKNSELINSGRDTIYNVQNNYHKGGENLILVRNVALVLTHLCPTVSFPDVISFFQIVAQLFVAWARKTGADEEPEEPDEVDISSIIPSDPSSLPISSIANRYTRCMLECMVGYPLYEPHPFCHHSKEYSRTGINVGDVGFIRDDGTFDFLFNICLPQNSLINPTNLPDGFSLETPEDSATRAVRPLLPNTCLVPETVKITETGEYICEGSEGAILELPEGAIQDEAVYIERFKGLAKRHGVEWYEYTMTQGRNISNGSLYLVTSFTKCTKWGIGIFDRRCNPGQGLTFDSNTLAWKGSKIFITKAADPVQENTINQCVFLRGYKIMIRQDIFDSLPKRQRAQRIRGGGGTDFLSRLLNTLQGSIVKKSAEVPLNANFNSPPIHPSDIINTALLSQNPNAKVAITHDNVWCNILEHNFQKFDYGTLVNTAKSYTSSIDEFGCISLEEISPRISTLSWELIKLVLLFLDIKSMLICRLVNRDFNEIIYYSTFFQHFLARRAALIIEYSHRQSRHLEEFHKTSGKILFDSLNGFLTSLSNLYKTITSFPMDNDRTSRWKITKIATFDYTPAFKLHEKFLVAEVACGSEIMCLRIEKELRKVNVTQSDHDGTPRLLASREIAYSDDLMNIVFYRLGEPQCVDVIRFPKGKGLSLPQIIVLAYSANLRGYLFFDRNHRLFIDAIVETMKLIETDFMLEENPKPKRGYWRNTSPALKPTAEFIGQVKTTYEEEWAAFNRDIEKTIKDKTFEQTLEWATGVTRRQKKSDKL